ncbi:MAG: pyruvate carboxylase subunit B [Chloroflexi bacterium]|jgi:pyruvate carboxylase subunit B|nr:MAG: pyruvate carboxylase subunit B [Chloroflexota bacterium]
MKDMEPIAAQMDQVGFASMEVWGGATFDATTRYLAEDPWERLRQFKKLITKTPLSMLLRGQSLVGYKAYADDVVDAFVERSATNGIDIFRVFDALNDEWNLIRAAEAVKNNGKHLQMAICYSVTESGKMGGPIYSLDYYLDRAKIFQEMGADSLCIKDMAGLLSPYDAFELISALKEVVTVPIQLHTHYTSGMASMTVLKAIEAGVDVVDACLAPLALRTSQPAVEPLVVTLRGTENDPKLDLDTLINLGDYLESILPKYREYLETPKVSVIDTKILSHQIPGGMASNLISQLREADSLDRLNEVLEDIPITRKELGYPPLVTPMSQMIGSQAVSNVLFGRYKMVSNQVKEYLTGMYGRPPSKVANQIKDVVFESFDTAEIKTINERPGNLIEPELKRAEKEVADITSDIDEILIYALYPTTGMKFLRIKHGLDLNADSDRSENHEITATGTKEVPVKSLKTKSFNVFVDDTFYKVEIDPINQNVVSISDGIRNPKPTRDSKPAENSNGELKSPMPGVFLKYLVEADQQVNRGDPIAVLEAMKMENTLPSPKDGRIQSLIVEPGQTVVKGDLLAIII